ncbi:MAG: DUF4832 domain-containing protein [Flavobacterium sp.]|nr:MAG: DUF4832 domain-containing protein [Flavobacterium sp.]
MLTAVAPAKISKPTMKKIYALIALFLVGIGSAQNATVNYTASSAAISNPERGFYHHTETHSSNYSALNQSTLSGYRTNSNITLILRVFYLEDFISSPISSTYLSSMQSDFAKIRAAGLKCIVRFAYSDDNGNGQPQDATKAQILAHIAQLKPILLANADIIPLAQAGFIGAWGEWYYTSNFGMNPTATDYANRKEVLNALLGALPAGRMVQIRTPSLKMNTLNNNSPISLTQAYTNTTTARVGHHNDCFLASEDDYGTYNSIASEYPYLEQETKYVPMGGETCAINAPRSKCESAIGEMGKFHWSFLNLDYHPGVISGFQADACFSTIENRLGYRFELVNGTYPQNANLGQALPITINIKNTGFATPYNARTAYLVLRNTVTGVDFKVPLSSDPRFWNPNSTTTITDNIPLPAGIVAGSYKLYLYMPDNDPTLATRPEYSIHMANSGTWITTNGYNDLNHTLNLGTSLGVEDHESTSVGLTVYPVPTNDQLTMEMPGISDYKVTVYNSLGQRVGATSHVESDSKMTLNTSALSNGVYFVTLANNTKKETRRIIVGH